MLSKPECFAKLFDDRDAETQELVELCQRFASPEHIDHGQTTHPSAQIGSLFQDYEKTVDGPLLAADIGLEVIRESCSHFDQWLTSLESLGKSIPPSV